jgi:hypothetical protein
MEDGCYSVSVEVIARHFSSAAAAFYHAGE